MAISAICMHCLKTISVEGVQTVCPDCGQPLNVDELKRNGLLIDRNVEASEFAIARESFRNAEFLSASEHFNKALSANKNSYLSQYYVRLCDIYLNENLPNFDVMRSAVEAITSSLELVPRSGVSINDKLNFIVATLTEIRIIISNRLKYGDELFESDINAYRAEKIHDLTTLLNLFKTDGELLMTYSPNVVAVLSEIADLAIAVCHKAVQSVIIGDELYTPSDSEYQKLASLLNDYNFFATSFSADYDINKYTPDFEQNVALNESVKARLEKFDANYKHDAKRFIVGNEQEYKSIMEECEKALTLTYYNCFKAFCEPELEERIMLLKDGLEFSYRLLMPYLTVIDKKKYVVVDNYVNICDKLEMLSLFLDEEDKFGKSAVESLHTFYLKLYILVESYFVDVYEKYSKIVNKLKESPDKEFEYYGTILFKTAVCCACALKKYMPFAKEKDRSRMKLAKFCRLATDEFLLLCDYSISELEQSNLYRPILDISNAVLNEDE